MAKKKIGGRSIVPFPEALRQTKQKIDNVNNSQSPALMAIREIVCPNCQAHLKMPTPGLIDNLIGGLAAGTAMALGNSVTSKPEMRESDAVEMLEQLGYTIIDPDEMQVIVKESSEIPN